MSDFIYLTNRNKCPHCRRARSPHDGNCANCGTRLFPSGPPSRAEDFEAETGVRYWWAWSGSTYGWKHRDFFMVPDAAPLVRHYEAPKIDKNYGRQTTPGEVAARCPRTTRTKRRERTRVKTVKV